jgi:tetratricopeptide (TPR) repeat protein
VLEVLRYLKRRQTYPAAEVLAWCDKLDPDKLSVEERRYPDRDGVERVDASPLEHWYGDRTKALEALGHWEELIVASNEALERVTQFHYNDEIWFRRRIANAKAELGDVDAAIGDLKVLVRLKPDWFIQWDLARLLVRKGAQEAALEYAVDAALGPGELAHKWELFALLGDLLAGQGDSTGADKHYRLAATIRAEQGWREDADLVQRLRDLPPVAPRSAAEQARELEGTWRGLKFADQNRVTGEIERTDPGKRNGFIRADDGRRIYFRYRSFVSPRERLMIGTKVSFFLQPSFDKLKNRESEEAVDVREIS